MTCGITAGCRPNSRRRLCLDESITTPRHARQALEMGACKVINIKPGRVGGLSHGLAIHDLCRARSVPVWCGGMLETGVGRAANLAIASLPGFTLPGDISATDRYYNEDITHERFSSEPGQHDHCPQRGRIGGDGQPEGIGEVHLAEAVRTCNSALLILE